MKHKIDTNFETISDNTNHQKKQSEIRRVKGVNIRMLY